MLPLEGVVVLDLTRLLPGPYCSMILADLGARVIKIEPPFGDYMREFDPKLKRNSAFYYAANRNKESISLDLKKGEEKETLLKLVTKADVVMEGFRPGVMDRLGIGYKRLKQENPSLVYCAITGFGQTGPKREMPGHDINLIALGGVLGQIGHKEGPPVVPTIQLADLTSAFWSAIGILAAVIRARATGEGSFVDVSMMDSVLSWLPLHFIMQSTTGKAPSRGDFFLSGMAPCYRVYETSDGRYVALGALEEKFWRIFCEAVNREDLMPHQFSQDPEIIGEIEAVFRSKSMKEWRELVENTRDLLISPVNSVQEVMEDPQVKARNMLRNVTHPQEGELAMVAPPFKMSGVEFGCKKLPPEVNEDRERVLRDLLGEEL
jgi:alpha-methylacyl-CoA racemase